MTFWKYMKAGFEEVAPKLPARDMLPRKVRLRSEWAALGVLLLLAVAYSLVVGSMLSRAYIDLGDGNYLYTSSRMADGLMIYRDFLSPQPPMHLLTGSALISLGRAIEGPAPVYTVRVFSMVLHLLTMGWIYLIGRQLIQTPWGGVLSAALYLLIPTGFWWSLGYQSELQEIFWMMGALYMFLRFRTVPMVIAGVMTALSVLTNMTAAPYAVASLVYLVVRHGIQKRDGEGWRLVIAYAAPLFGIITLVAGYYEIRTGAYFENVIGNQISSYPKGRFWAYAFGKVVSQGAKILTNEGGFVLLGLLGLILYNRTDSRTEREYLVWYSLALLLSLLYVSKGGTMDYIFTIGEPVLAVFGAYFLSQFLYPSTWRRFFTRKLWEDTTLIPHVVFVLLVVIVVGFFPARFFSQVLAGAQFEQSEEQLDYVTYLIRENSEPDEAIVAQPYYAFVADRKLLEEYSELYLWTLQYSLEIKTMTLGEGEIADAAGLRQQLTNPQRPFDRWLAAQIEDEAMGRIKAGGDDLASVLREAINAVLYSERFYSPDAVAGLTVPNEVGLLLSDPMLGANRIRINRLLLETAYPMAIRRSEAARDSDGKGVRKVKSIARKLQAREVPVVVASVSPPNLQLLRSEEVRSAIYSLYRPLIEDEELPQYRTMNFQMQVFVPKTDAELRADRESAENGGERQ